MCSALPAGRRRAPLGLPPAHLLDGTDGAQNAVPVLWVAGRKGGDVARPGGDPSAAHRELRLLREPRCSSPAPLTERAELCGLVEERGPAWCVPMSGSAGAD